MGSHDHRIGASLPINRILTNLRAFRKAECLDDGNGLPSTGTEGPGRESGGRRQGRPRAADRLVVSSGLNLPREAFEPVLRETVGHLRDLPRYRQILATLVRYGYHDVVTALHLEGIVRPIERVATG